MHSDYEEVINKWEQMTEQEQIEALKKARIWHPGMKLNQISYYTKKVTLNNLEGKIKF